MRLAFEDAQERGGATSLHASHVSALRIVTTIICAGSKESADALEASTHSYGMPSLPVAFTSYGHNATFQVITIEA